jgi:hypothetical protein
MSDSGSDHSVIGITNNKRHNEKPITSIESSSDGKWVVTYSDVDNSIVGWSSTDDEGMFELIADRIPINDKDKNDQMKQMCVSNDGKLAYIHGVQTTYTISK